MCLYLCVCIQRMFYLFIYLFHECYCSLAACNMPITAAGKIGAAQIQHYFEDATGKKDWSKRAWAEWCTMEKGLHPDSMATLSEVISSCLDLVFLVFMCVLLILDRQFALLTHAGFQIL